MTNCSKVMSKGVHNIAFSVTPDGESYRTTPNSVVGIAPSWGHILYAKCGNTTSNNVVTAIDKILCIYYVSTLPLAKCSHLGALSDVID
jgi:hypothetical protein